MKRSFLFLFPTLLLLTSCGAEVRGGNGKAPGSSAGSQDSSGAFPLTVVDASGDTVTLSSPPERIISLVPSASQVLLALGAGPLLVGRTDFDTAQALADLPSVGGGLNPNLEAVVALEPDLVIRFAGESDPATPRRLNQLGISHLAVRPDGLQDIRNIILNLGLITGRRWEADSLLNDMATELEALQNRVAGLPRIRVAYLLGGNPPWVAGPGSYIHELLELAGGTNVFTDLDALYGPVNAEVFLVRKIDLILAPEGTEIILPDASIPIRRVSPDLEIPGPTLAQQARTLARAIHPEAFQ